MGESPLEASRVLMVVFLETNCATNSKGDVNMITGHRA